VDDLTVPHTLTREDKDYGKGFSKLIVLYHTERAIEKNLLC
jgi:hypothetical protein